jgi:predicted metal-dependent enzyme (double-stranded beta helix superfamily)
MCDTGYGLKSLVDDLRCLESTHTTEADMLREVPLLAKRLVLAKHNWLRPSMCVPSTTRGSAGVHWLHEEDDHSLAIVVVTWLPGEETPPHDHGTWAVIAGLEGRETNHFWRRLDDGSIAGYAHVERDGRQTIEYGSILAMPSRAIHSVQNDSEGVSVSLHLYGMNVDFTDRRKFDPATRSTARYPMGGTVIAAPAA